MTTKRCPKCGQVKPTIEFSRNKRSRDGLQSSCKDCNRAYREAHREQKREYNRAYHEANREEILAKKRAYEEAHREQKREYDRQRKALIGDPTVERWQEITSKHATRKRDPWSEAEDAYLADSTDRIVDDALALKRTYESVETRIKNLRGCGVTLARDQHKTTT